jgi:hypothetical protein
MKSIFARLTHRLCAPGAAFALYALASAGLIGFHHGGALAGPVPQSQSVHEYDRKPSPHPFYSDEGFEQSVLKPRLPRPKHSPNWHETIADPRPHDDAIAVVFSYVRTELLQFFVRPAAPHTWRSRAPPLFAF